MLPDDELADLIETYLDGDLSPPETERLDQALRSSRKAKDVFWRIAQERALLRAAAQETGQDEAIRTGPLPALETLRPARRGAIIALKIVGSLAAAAAVLVTFHLHRESRQIRGELCLTVVEADGVGQQLRPDAIVRPGQRVHTTPREAVRLAYPDGSEVHVRADSRLLVVDTVRNGNNKCIHLERGLLMVDARPQPDSRPMVLTTPHAVATVLGTQFALRVSQTRTQLRVREGSVQFDRRDSTSPQLVRAGELASTTLGAATPARGVVALYLFDEGEGRVVHDWSGADQPLDLVIDGAGKVRWRSNGLAVVGPAKIQSKTLARKIIRRCQESRELTVEAWVRPSEETAGKRARSPRPIVSVSRTRSEVNVRLAQGSALAGASDCYECGLRTGKGRAAPPPGPRVGWRRVETVAHGIGLAAGILVPLDPLGRLATLHLNGIFQSRGRRARTWHAAATNRGTVTPALTHLVFSRDRSGVMRVFVNGKEARRAPAKGDFANWHRGSRLILAGEALPSASGGRHWRGEYCRVAIYSTALTAEEVQRRFRMGARTRE